MTGAAHFRVSFDASQAKARRPANSKTTRVPASVAFREVKSRGLLARAWLNDKGPFNVVLDTGAGITIISEGLARDIGARQLSGRATMIAGLSGREVSAREVIIDRTALGDRSNSMPGSIRALVAPRLPEDIDAILDPTDAYSPLGYTIDLPNRTISAFDPVTDGLNKNRPPVDGAIVPWLRDGQGSRPFVRLSDGRKALIDTGSTFGLAFSDSAAMKDRDHVRAVTDVGGGSIRSRRVDPSTVSIGDLVLRDVPTDVLDGVEKGAPVILGRDALYPFRLTFDPVHRLIEIAPGRNS